MKVWFASFQLSQERLFSLLIACFILAEIGWGIDRWVGVAVLPAQLAAVPLFWGIANPILRIAVLALALWVALTIAFTIKIRLDIRRDNYVRPKQ